MIVTNTCPEGRFLVPYLDGAKVASVVRADTKLGRLWIKIRAPKGRRVLGAMRRLSGHVQLLDVRTLPEGTLAPASLDELPGMLDARQYAELVILGPAVAP